MTNKLECFGTANTSDCCMQCPDNSKCAEETIQRAKLGVRCTSCYCDTNESFEKDETKIYFSFVDYPNKMKYKGAVAWNVLFNFLKPQLKREKEEH